MFDWEGRRRVYLQSEAIIIPRLVAFKLNCTLANYDKTKAASCSAQLSSFLFSPPLSSGNAFKATTVWLNLTFSIFLVLFLHEDATF